LLPNLLTAPSLNHSTLCTCKPRSRGIQACLEIHAWQNFQLKGSSSKRDKSVDMDSCAKNRFIDHKNKQIWSVTNLLGLALEGQMIIGRRNVTLAGVSLPTPFEESWLRLNLNCNYDFEEFIFNIQNVDNDLICLLMIMKIICWCWLTVGSWVTFVVFFK